MIAVTRLDGTHLYVNADLIEFVEETPDTIITLRDGKKLVVREHAAQLREALIAYYRRIHAPFVVPPDAPAGEQPEA
jgi:flagellar protein FlbD